MTKNIEKKEKKSEIFDFFNFGGPPPPLTYFCYFFHYDFRNQRTRQHKNSPTPIHFMNKSMTRPTLMVSYIAEQARVSHVM